MNMPSLNTKALVDIHDGDAPNIRMPVRMLSIDTPEVTEKPRTVPDVSMRSSLSWQSGSRTGLAMCPSRAGWRSSCCPS